MTSPASPLGPPGDRPQSRKIPGLLPNDPGHAEGKEADDDLRYQFELTRSITDNAAESIFMMDVEGRVTFMNPEAEAMFGYSREEMMGSVLHDMLHHHHPDGRPFPIGECPLGKVFLEGANTMRNHEDVFFCKDGRQLDVICSNAPIFDRGRVTGAVLVVHDVTPQKQAERRLRESDRRKTEFLAMLAHELRNPLAAIRNALQVARAPDSDQDDADWANRVLERQSLHLGELVDDLLDVARITSGKVRLDKKPVDAAQVLDGAVAAVNQIVNERNHELLPSYPRNGDLLVEGDSTRLEQIFVNLLTNAAKYTEPGGRIWLKAAREQGQVVVSVRDTGTGIAADKLPEMFELFAQGERGIARSEGGLGLGLTIVRSLAEMHGGSIEARSDGVGKGSEFTVRLPALQLPPAGTAHPGDTISGGAESVAGLRVLIVDDNTDTADGLARLLKRKGFTVEVSYNGLKACDTARVFYPHSCCWISDSPEWTDSR